MQIYEVDFMNYNDEGIKIKLERIKMSHLKNITFKKFNKNKWKNIDIV